MRRYGQLLFAVSFAVVFLNTPLWAGCVCGGDEVSEALRGEVPQVQLPGPVAVDRADMPAEDNGRDISDRGVDALSGDVSGRVTGRRTADVLDMEGVSSAADRYSARESGAALSAFGYDDRNVVHVYLRDYALPLPADSAAVPTGQLFCRDPFVLADPVSRLYFLPVRGADGQSFMTYASRDLHFWRSLGKSFTPDSTFWGESDFWAPDLFYYGGRYYLAATFSAPATGRGCSLLVSDKPSGPFEPLTEGPLTPLGWTCLDATLWLDEGRPWLIFCREWLEVTDGEVWAMPLTEDLTAAAGEPVLLFSASEARWTGPITAYGKTGYVTDAPFVWRTESGELLMLWSSFARLTDEDQAAGRTEGKYSIGVAWSKGGLTGPWIHEKVPLNDDDGGHAMIVRAFGGQLHISYHAPNSGPTHAVIRPLRIRGRKVTIMY